MSPTEHWFLIRGLVRGAAHWMSFPHTLQDTLPGIVVSHLEIPGNGARHRERTPTTVPGMVDMMRPHFLRQRDVTDAPKRVLMALSLGGMVALDWLQRFPDDFDAAVIVNTSVGNLDPMFQRLRLPALPNMIHSVRTKNFVERELITLGFTSNNPDAHPDVAKAWAEERRRHPVSGANTLRQIIAAARFRPTLKPFNIPVLIISGDGDRLVDPRCSVRLAHAIQAEHRVHPTAGHNITVDDAAWTLEQLRAWRMVALGEAQG